MRQNYCYPFAFKTNAFSHNLLKGNKKLAAVKEKKKQTEFVSNLLSEELNS